MTIQKQCADYLRTRVLALTGGTLKASYAHELVAAYFGYGTAAALQAEAQYPLTGIVSAKFLVPDLARMDVRVTQLRGLPPNLPAVDQLASAISGALAANGHFGGEVWQGRMLDDDVNDYVQRNALLIEDALSGEIATTNAFFDELYIEEYGYHRGPDDLVVTLDGALNGETDQDRVFHGDKIVFSTTMTFKRAAGRIAFEEPAFETSGSVDDSDYYDPE